MELYFLRHGIAADRAEWEGDDAARPLTQKGRDSLANVGSTMAGLGLEFGLILTSPLLRARETAEIVARRLRVPDRLKEEPRLGPGFDLLRLRAILKEGQDGDKSALLLVGHEPDFSQTVSELIGGGTLVMKKGGLARVRLDSLRPPKGHLVWLVPPKILALPPGKKT
jgi:phosphohistidine phosphatase